MRSCNGRFCLKLFMVVVMTILSWGPLLSSSEQADASEAETVLSGGSPDETSFSSVLPVATDKVWPFSKGGCIWLCWRAFFFVSTLVLLMEDEPQSCSCINWSNRFFSESLASRTRFTSSCVMDSVIEGTGLSELTAAAPPDDPSDARMVNQWVPSQIFCQSLMFRMLWGYWKSSGSAYTRKCGCKITLKSSDERRTGYVKNSMTHPKTNAVSELTSSSRI